MLLPICVVHEQNCYKTQAAAPRFRAVAPNLFGTRNHRKTIFRGPGDGEGNGFGLLQVHYTYHALYFYCYYIRSTSDRQALSHPGGWGPMVYQILGRSVEVTVLQTEASQLLHSWIPSLPPKLELWVLSICTVLELAECSWIRIRKLVWLVRARGQFLEGTCWDVPGWELEQEREPRAEIAWLRCYIVSLVGVVCIEFLT